MKLIVCVENSMGLMFNNRRVSMDRAVVEDIKEWLGGARLSASRYTSNMLKDYGCSVDRVTDMPGADDTYYFLEDADVSSISGEISKIVLYRWNRNYPFDRKFDVDLAGYRLESCYEFVGNSHEKLTREVYVR